MLRRAQPDTIMAMVVPMARAGINGLDLECKCTSPTINLLAACRPMVRQTAQIMLQRACHTMLAASCRTRHGADSKLASSPCVCLASE
jgi:hypothetical protein